MTSNKPKMHRQRLRTNTASRRMDGTYMSERDQWTIEEIPWTRPYLVTEEMWHIPTPLRGKPSFDELSERLNFVHLCRYGCPSSHYQESLATRKDAPSKWGMNFTLTSWHCQRTVHQWHLSSRSVTWYGSWRGSRLPYILFLSSCRHPRARHIPANYRIIRIKYVSA